MGMAINRAPYDVTYSASSLDSPHVIYYFILMLLTKLCWTVAQSILLPLLNQYYSRVMVVCVKWCIRLVLMFCQGIDDY